MLFEFACGREDDHWIFSIKLLGVSFSIRADWGDYPGLTVTFGILDYYIGANVMKNECQTA